MAFNPSPKVAAARDFADKFDKKITIILSVDADQRLESVSYGQNRRLCAAAKKMSDLIFDELNRE